MDLDFTIERLGAGSVPSPMPGGRFTSDGERLLYHSRYEDILAFVTAGSEPPALELAGGTSVEMHDLGVFPRLQTVIESGTARFAARSVRTHTTEGLSALRARSNADSRSARWERLAST